MDTEDAQDAFVTIKRLYESLLNDKAANSMGETPAPLDNTVDPAAESTPLLPPESETLLLPSASSSLASPISFMTSLPSPIYFTITNDLLNIINTHFGENYSLISADESKSIKENCAIVREAMSIILELSKREEKKIRGIIEPDIYDKIAFTGVPLKDKAALIKNFHADQLGVFGSVLLPLVAIQLARSDLEIVKPPNEDLDLPVLSLKLGDLLKSSKSITKLLCEQGNQQTNHTQIVEDAISVLKPLCDAYNRIAGGVQAYVGIVSENIKSHH
ncbi:hypothetical protein Q8A67_002925 [Cirrhinus molitorella]|uniref:Uncharacterized protein n=1 Tax=Cirrhinus molitorella TaxID=172907 RepID=A0AA88Q842_9TELE|nr:hypothetical protein Q8A67_002925 [Cirrhinus molitorella]